MPRTSDRSLALFVLPRPLCALLVALLFMLSAAGPAHAAPASAPAPANPAAPVALTPKQAQSALHALEDPAERTRIADTLRAIAAAGALAQPAPAPAASGASTPASPPAAASLAQALSSNGLVRQVSSHVARSAHVLVQRLVHSRSALLDFGSARAWWAHALHSEAGRGLLIDLARLLLVTLIPALIVEALIRRLVARARRATLDHVLRGSAMHAAGQRSSALPWSPQPAPTSASAAAAASSGHHWTRLQRLPAALLVLVLNLLPVVAFGVATTAILSWAAPDESPASLAVGALVDTYVICRIVLVFCSLLFAPNAAPLRMLPLSDQWARLTQRWALRLVIVGGVGGALDACEPLGLTPDAHLALVKLVALVGHLMLAVAILQCRRPVAAALRDAAARRPPVAWFGRWLADIWAGAAVFIVIALWLVWAFDLHNGYRELAHAGALSLVVLLAARLTVIVVLGALGRLFDPGSQHDTMSVGRRRAYRYFPWLRRLALLVIGLITFDVLLHVWNIHPGRLIINASLQRLIGSALLTIAIAVVIAIVLWETANIAAERRLEAWTSAGDYVRAARLRTLLPMLRTSLLVAILVIIGLTALSQLGVNTGPLVAGASIFGVALGFGSQKLVQDFITGIFLLTENAMQVGDWVTVAGVSGTVEFLSIRTVRLRGGDGSLYTVPFSSVTTVNNTNRGIGNAAVKVVIAHDADVERAIAALKDIGSELRADDAFKNGILSDFAYWGVDDVNGATVTLVGQIQCTDSARWGVQREFNRRVLDRFTQRGIELANPQRQFVDLKQTGTQAQGKAGEAQQASDNAGTDQPKKPDDNAKPAA